MRLEDVPMWGTFTPASKGHAIASTQSGWSLTACEEWSPSITLTTKRPARICGRCRARLKFAHKGGRDAPGE